MEFDAAALSRSAASNSRLRSIIGDQCRVIRGRLRRHTNLWGTNVVAHELPSLIDVAGLDQETARLVVYDQILAYLDGLGFKTYFHRSDRRAFVYVVWQTKLSDAEAAAMRARLEAHSIGDAEAKALLTRSGPCAAREPGKSGDHGRVRPLVLSPPRPRELQPRGGTKPARPPVRPPSPGPRKGPTPAEIALLSGA